MPGATTGTKNEYLRKREVSLVDILMRDTMYQYRAGTLKYSAHSAPTIASLSQLQQRKLRFGKLTCLVSHRVTNRSSI